MEEFYNNLSLWGKHSLILLSFIAVSSLLGWLLAFLTLRSLRVYSERKSVLTTYLVYGHIHKVAYFFAPLLIMIFTIKPLSLTWPFMKDFRQVVMVLFYIATAMLLRKLVFAFSDRIKEAYNITSTDNNLYARKIQTQLQYLRRIVLLGIYVLCVSLILLSFEGVRKLGIGLLSSAGVLGIIMGIAAQKSLGNLLAGLQIAFTQPIRMDDVVVVEGEWGKIEEITLTYVVVRIWDLRRLVLPLNYFIEKPFQNWTRTSADILGSVFLYTDYTLPIDPLRKKLTEVLKKSPLWDGKVNVLQVTNTTDKSMELRALMSARESSQAWDLRCIVREELLTFIQTNYPECLPRTRAIVEGQAISTQQNNGQEGHHSPS